MDGLRTARLGKAIRVLIQPAFVAGFFASAVGLLTTDVSLKGSNDPNIVQSVAAVRISTFVPLYLFLLVSGFVVVSMHRRWFTDVVIVSTVSMVMLDFWQFHSPFGLFDDISKLVNNVLIAHGSSLAPQGWLQWPSLFVLGETFNVIVMPTNFLTVFLACYAAILGLMVYAIMMSVVEDSKKAYIGTLAALGGNISLGQFMYHPDFLVIPIVLTCVLLFAASQTRGTGKRSFISFGGPSRLMAVLVGISIVTWNTVGPVITAIFVILIFLRGRTLVKSAKVGSSLPLLFMMPLFIWNLFWSVGFFGNIVGGISSFLSNFTGGYNHVLHVYSGNAQFAPWATDTRFIWLVAGVLLPFAFSLFLMFRGRTSRSTSLSTFVLAVMVAGGLTFLLNGVNSFLVFLYVPLVGIALLIKLVEGLKWGVVATAVFVFLMVVPAFFAFNPSVQSYSVAPEEASAGLFIAVHYPLQIIFSSSTYAELGQPQINTISYPSTFSTISGSDFSAVQVLAGVKSYFTQFESSRGALLEYQSNFLYGYYHLYGTDTGALITNYLQARLGSSDLVFSNEFSTLYYAEL